METYRINIKPTAESDIEKRYRQIAEESPANALNWYYTTINAIKTLDRLPERCPLAPENADIQQNIRHLIIANYRILFRANDDVVEILHVRHSGHDRIL